MRLVVDSTAAFMERFIKMPCIDPNKLLAEKKLCGKDHAYMPIAVRVVSPEAYTAWLATAKKAFALNGKSPIAVAGDIHPTPAQ